MRRRVWLLAGATIVGGAALALGPAAPWLVDHLADGQRAWRLGRLQVEGVSGAWLGDLHAQHVSISDETGVWLEAEDVALRWRPFDLFDDAFTLHSARIGAINVVRRPALSAPRPARGGFDAHLGEIEIENITLAEAFVGEAAAFSAALALDYSDKRLEQLAVDLRRTDSDADRATIRYASGADFELRTDIVGEAGGVLSTFLGAPDQAVRAEARGDGDASAGEASYSAQVGVASLLRGDVRWSTSEWAANAEARFDLLPSFASLARRIGASATLSASGAPAGAFTARAATPFLNVDLSGVLDEAGALVDGAHFVATTARLSDIARESPFELGEARLDGELRRARGTTAIEAILDAEDVRALGERTRFNGPVRAALTPERFTLDADLRAATPAPALFANARLSTDLAYDRTRQRFALDTAKLEGDAISADAQGWSSRGDGEFSGTWRVRQLEALAPSFSGEAQGRWRGFDEEAAGARGWTIAIDGRGARVSTRQEALAQALGATPQLDARLRADRGGLTVLHARIDGTRLRAGATGRIVRGQANLALEASARGPLQIGGAEIVGAVDATGQLTGALSRPTLTARASFSSLAVGGLVVEQPVLDFTLAPQGEAYTGRAGIEGAASGQPLTAAADIALDGGAITLRDLDAQWGGLQAQGSAAFANASANANLDINGVMDGLAPGLTGRVAGALALTPDALTLDATLADTRLGELRVRSATLHAEGPLDALNARFDMRGRLGQAPLTFAGQARIARENAATLVYAEGAGELAGTPLTTRAPIEARFTRGAVDASLEAIMSDGVVTARWRDAGRALSGAAHVENAPLAPLAAIWGERATGRISGAVNLTNQGGGLSGDADLRVTQARFAGRQRGTLDLRVVGDLDPSRLAATIDATSTEGLVARFEADAPVVTSTAPIRIALAPERRGRATWSMRGPADSLWAAARLPDQSLDGQLDGAGELSFGAGYLSGDGHIEIVDGRFEDKRTGITLTDLDVRLGLSDAGVAIETFTATSPHGGRLTATGGSANPRNGAISVRVDDMRIADRPDARATASGDLTLAWEGMHTRLSGALVIDEAELDIAASSDAGIPTLDVVEVNRPDEEDQIEPAAAVRRNGSTELDVRITAPGRVFTRGRGVDAEWALDLRLDGTARAPNLFGDARAVRGTLALSGQPFEIDNALIFFNGDPLDAQIDMSATRDTADLTARIRLTGTARDPEIAFSSDPALPEDEILPQILFGRSVADLSAFEAAQLAASIAALSGTASIDLMDAARAAAGLDRLNVRQDENGGFLVAGGVYLTRDVYVEVARTGLGQAQTRVEWTVRPRLVLITSFRGDGDQRVSLRWRRESD